MSKPALYSAHIYSAHIPGQLTEDRASEDESDERREPTYKISFRGNGLSRIKSDLGWPICLCNPFSCKACSGTKGASSKKGRFFEDRRVFDLRFRRTKNPDRISEGPPIREMGEHLAPRNHLLVWIVKASGRPCTDGHLTSRVLTED